MKKILILVASLLLAACGDRTTNSNSGSGGGYPSAVRTPTTPSNVGGVTPQRIESTDLVWKPVSEKGGVAILTPASHTAYTNAVVYSYSTGVKYGICPYDKRTNGNRPTYRCPSVGSAYPSPSVMKIGDAYYYIANPANRYG